MILGNKKRLILFDFDGVCVKPGILTMDSITEVANLVLEYIGHDSISEELWQEIFKQTTGTTELALIEHISGIFEFDATTKDIFKEMYLYGREMYISQLSREHDQQYEGAVDETYFDALCLLEYLSINEENVIWLTSGNPSKVMRQRLLQNPDFIDYFGPRVKEGFGLNGAFGEEAMSRSELIKIAIQRAIDQGFVPEYDETGKILNIVYIGDAPHDLVAGIEMANELGVRTVLLRRNYIGNEYRDLRWEIMLALTSIGRANVVKDDYRYDVDLRRVFVTSTLTNPLVAEYIVCGTHYGEKGLYTDYKNFIEGILGLASPNIL